MLTNVRRRKRRISIDYHSDTVVKVLVAPAAAAVGIDLVLILLHRLDDDMSV